MAFSSSLSALNRPNEVADLLITPVTEASVALTVSNVWNTESHSATIPIWTGDPAAEWLPENDEIPASEATGKSITVTPAKIAGISFISNELAQDTSPEVALIIGQRLAADIGHKIDRAFFGPHITDPMDPSYNSTRPAGLESIPLEDLSRIDASPEAKSLDAFADAVAAAEDAGVTIQNWVTTPQIKLELSKLKTGTGSNAYLLDRSNGEMSINGAPVRASRHVTAGSVWGLHQPRTFVVVRKDTTVEFDSSYRFGHDQIAVRGVMRLTFAFPHRQSVVLIRD